MTDRAYPGTTATEGSGMTQLFGLKGTLAAQKPAFSFFQRPRRDSGSTKTGVFVLSADPEGL